MPSLTAAGGFKELGYAEITSNQTTANNGPDDVTGLTVTVTVGTRPVLVRTHIPAVANGTALQFTQVTLQEGGTVISQSSLFQSNSAGQASPPLVLQRRLSPSAGSHTYKVTFGKTAFSSASTVTLSAGATNPASIQVIEL